jgi:DNA-binding NarL/FixJ family response regulator
MPRVVRVCTESVLCERLRQAFQSHAEFEICGGVKKGAGTLKKAIEPHPDLVVLEMAGDPQYGFETAQKLKLILPRVA